MSTFPGPLAEYPLICIDSFMYQNFKCTAFFLSHCHSDHMKGLNSPEFLNLLTIRCFNRVYISEVSRSILLSDDSYHGLIPFLETIPLEESTIIPVPDENGNKVLEVVVTLIPAGHCPGSVMFLFEGPEGTVLYTGDFRLMSGSTKRIRALHHPDGRVKTIKTLYLDSTFCSEKTIILPSRQDSLRAIINLIDPWLNESVEHHVFFITPARIGYEAVFIEVYKRIGMRVHVCYDKFEMYRGIPDVLDALTTDIATTRVHCCKCFPPRTKGRPKLQLLPCAGNIYFKGRIQFVKLSAMFFVNYPSLQDLVEFDEERNIHRVCFSTHSSLAEVLDMAQYLRPLNMCANVVPSDSTPDEVIEPLLSALNDDEEEECLEDLPLVIPPLGTLKFQKQDVRHNYEDTDRKDFVFSVPFSQETCEYVPASTSQEDSVGERRNLSYLGFTESPSNRTGTSRSGIIEAPNERNSNSSPNDGTVHDLICSIPLTYVKTNSSDSITGPASDVRRTPEKSISFRSSAAKTNAIHIKESIKLNKSDNATSSGFIKFPNKGTLSLSQDDQRSPDKRTGSYSSKDRTLACETDEKSTSESVKPPTCDANDDTSHKHAVPVWDYPSLVIDGSYGSDVLSSPAEQNSEKLSEEGPNQSSESDRGNSSSVHLSEDDTELLSGSEKRLPPVTEVCSPEKEFATLDGNQKSSSLLGVRTSVCLTACSTSSPTVETVASVRKELRSSSSDSQNQKCDVFKSIHDIPFSNSPIEERNQIPSQSLISSCYVPHLSVATVLGSNSDYSIIPSCRSKLPSRFVGVSPNSVLYKNTSEALDLSLPKIASCATSSSSSLHLSSDESPVLGKRVLRSRSKSMSQHQGVSLISQLPAYNTTGSKSSHVACQSLPSRRLSRQHGHAIDFAKGHISDENINQLQKRQSICGSDHDTGSSLSISVNESPDIEKASNSKHVPSLLDRDSIFVRYVDEGHSKKFTLNNTNLVQMEAESSAQASSSNLHMLQSPSCEVKSFRNDSQDANSTVLLEEQIGRDVVGSTPAVPLLDCNPGLAPLPCKTDITAAKTDITVTNETDTDYLPQKNKEQNTLSGASDSVSQNVNDNQERPGHLRYTPVYPPQSKQQITENILPYQGLESPSHTVKDSVSTDVCHSTPLSGSSVSTSVSHSTPLSGSSSDSSSHLPSLEPVILFDKYHSHGVSTCHIDVRHNYEDTDKKDKKDCVFSVPFSQETCEYVPASTSKEDSGERRNLSHLGFTESPSNRMGTSRSGIIEAPNERNGNSSPNNGTVHDLICSIPLTYVKTNSSDSITGPASDVRRTPEKSISFHSSADETNAIHIKESVKLKEGDNATSSGFIKFPNKRTVILSQDDQRSPDKRTASYSSKDRTLACETDEKSTSESVKPPACDANDDTSHKHAVPVWDYPSLVIDGSYGSDVLSSPAEQNSEKLSEEGPNQSSESDSGNSSSVHLSEDDTELLSRSEKRLPPVTEVCSPAKEFATLDGNQKSSSLLGVRTSVCLTACSTSSPTVETVASLRKELRSSSSDSQNQKCDVFKSIHDIPFSNSPIEERNQIPSQSLISSCYVPHLSVATVLGSNSDYSIIPSCRSKLPSRFIGGLCLRSDESRVLGKRVLRSRSKSMSLHQGVSLISQLPAYNMTGSKSSHGACQSLPSRRSSRQHGHAIDFAKGHISDENINQLQKRQSICGSDHDTGSSLSISVNESPDIEKASNLKHVPSLLDRSIFMRYVDEGHSKKSTLNHTNLVQMEAESSAQASSSNLHMFQSPSCEVKSSRNDSQDANSTVLLEEQIGRDVVGSTPAVPLLDCNPGLAPLPCKTDITAAKMDITVTNETDTDYLPQKNKGQYTISGASYPVSQNVNDNQERPCHLRYTPVYPPRSKQKVTENILPNQSLASPSHTVKDTVSTNVCHSTPLSGSSVGTNVCHSPPLSRSSSDSSSHLPPLEPVLLVDKYHSPGVSPCHIDKATFVNKIGLQPSFRSEKEVGDPVIGQDAIFVSINLDSSTRKRVQQDSTSAVACKKQKICDFVSIVNSSSPAANSYRGSLSSPELFCNPNSPELKISGKESGNTGTQNSPSFENVQLTSKRIGEKELGTNEISPSRNVAPPPVSCPSNNVQNSLAPACQRSLSSSPEVQLFSFTDKKANNGEKNAKSKDLDPNCINEISNTSCQESVEMCSSPRMLFLSSSSDEQSQSNTMEDQISVSVESRASPPQNNSFLLLSQCDSSDTESSAGSDCTEEFSTFGRMIPERSPSPISEHVPPLVTKHGILILDEPAVITVSSDDDDDDVTSNIIAKSSSCEILSSSPCSESLVSGVPNQQHARFESNPKITMIDLASDSE